MEDFRSGYRILVADDDVNVHQSLNAYFRREGYQMLSAYNGEEALAFVRKYRPDIMLLDIMMPKMDGLMVCREARKDSNVPIIMLSAKGDEFDKLLGLELGADDYITKPFSPREVVARIKAVLRRIHELTESSKGSHLVAGNLDIDMSAFIVKLGDEVIPCTPKEVEILHMLTSNVGQVFSREQILSRVWGYDYFGDTRTVDAHIKRIRQKLPQENVPWALKTVYGVGYRFEVNA